MKLGQTSVLVFVSQFSASVVAFVATVYLARFVPSAVLGQYFLVVAVVIWLRVLGTLGLPLAITKRVSESDERGAYVSAGLVLVLAAFVVIAVGLAVFSRSVNDYVGAPVVRYLYALVFVGIGFLYVSAVLRGEKLVHVASFLQPLNYTVRSVLQIAAVFAGLGLFAIIGGYLVGLLAATVVGLFFVRTSFVRPSRRHFERLLSYAKYSWIGALQSRTFASLDTIVLAAFVASDFIAYYEIAWNVASMLAIFGTAISQTIFPEISDISTEESRDRIEGIVEDSFTYTGLFMIPGLVGGAIIGGWVLGIYGQEYRTAYEVLVVLISARLVYSYAAQLMTAINGLDRPDVTFRIHVAFVLTNLVLNVVLIAAIGWFGAAVATLISAFVPLVLGTVYFDRLLSVPFVGSAKQLTYQVVAALVMGVVVYGGRSVLAESIPATLLLVVAGASVYFGSLLGLSGKFRGVVVRNLPTDRFDRFGSGP